MLSKFFSSLICAILLLLGLPRAFATDPDGIYALNGIPANNVMLVCSCNGTPFTVPPTLQNDVANFSMVAIYTQMLQSKATCPMTPNPTSPTVPSNLYDLTLCKFQSTDPSPIIYANVDITALGDHCMDPTSVAGANGCRTQWAVAANFDVQPVSAIADYMVNNAPTTGQKIPGTNFACGGKTCYNQWTGTILKTIPGSIAITGAPAGLQANCALGPNNFIADPDLTIDFASVYQQLSPTVAGQTLTAICHLSLNGQDYGSLSLQDLNGIRDSRTVTGAHLWSVSSVNVATQPPEAVNIKINTPAVADKSDVDKQTGNYHNLWNVSMQPAIYAGSLLVTGGPADLTVNCTNAVGNFYEFKPDPKLGDVTIDFQSVHDQAAAGHPETTLDFLCAFRSAGLNFGVLKISALNGIRQSKKYPGSALWSAQVSIDTQPGAVTGYVFDAKTLQHSGDSDSSLLFFTNWTVALKPASANK